MKKVLLAAAAVALASGHFRPAAWAKAGFNADIVDLAARRRPPSMTKSLADPGLILFVDKQGAGLEAHSGSGERRDSNSTIRASVAPFAPPAGSIESSSSTLGLAVGWPSLSSAQPSGIGLPSWPPTGAMCHAAPK